MTRAILFSAGFCILLGACTQRMVCPAYQSAFIYDKDQLRKKFSYFQEDSTPKLFTASKTKYLIAEPTPYRKKLRSLQTVAVKKIFVEVPDSISGIKSDSVSAEALDKAARSVIDSTYIVDVPQQADSAAAKEDSIYVITKDREVRILKYNTPDSLVYDANSNKFVPQKPKYYVTEVGFNTEQDNYMWYLRHNLVLPDVRLAKLQANGKGEEKAGQKTKEKKGFFGFFKNLFKKKNKEDIDSAELELPSQKDEFDFIDTTAQVDPEIPPQAETTKEKKGLLSPKTDNEELNASDPLPADKSSRKKKKKKADKKKTEEPQVQEKKKEDEDDGF